MGRFSWLRQSLNLLEDRDRVQSRGSNETRQQRRSLWDAMRELVGLTDAEVQTLILPRHTLDPHYINATLSPSPSLSIQPALTLPPLSPTSPTAVTMSPSSMLPASMLPGSVPLASIPPASIPPTSVPPASISSTTMSPASMLPGKIQTNLH